MVPLGAAAVDAGRIGAFPTWSVAAGTATGTFTGSAAMPALEVTSSGNGFGTATGASAFLGASTGFGAEFGSSRLQPYLTVGTSGVSTSTTSVSFGAAPAGQWGFALGDIDADWAFLRAYDAAGNPLSSAGDLSALGFRGTGNYCLNSPKPSTCGSGAASDAPVWITTPTAVDSTCLGVTTTTNYVPGTLRGNVADSSGAYGWFAPSASVARVDILFGALCGIPTFQLWVAGSAPIATITGTVTPSVPSATLPTGVIAALRDADSAPVLDSAEQPVTAPVEADGSFQFDVAQQAEPFEIAFVVPAGVAPIAPIVAPADSANPAPLTITAVVVDAGVAPVVDPAEPALAPTGPNEVLAPLAVAILASGLLLVGLARVRARRHG
jgi:hypothetical protein